MELAPFEATLRNSTKVLVRAVTPDDKHLLEIGFDHLSDRSRYFRFLRPARKLSERERTQFTERNNPDHEAIGALDTNFGPSTPVAIARYVRLPDQPDHAEVAVTVVDSHQGIGLGTLLIGALAKHAEKNAISAFVALVHSENSPMLRLFMELGATVERRDQWEEELQVPIHNDPELYPRTAVGDAVRAVYATASFESADDTCVAGA